MSVKDIAILGIVAKVFFITLVDYRFSAHVFFFVSNFLLSAS